MFAELVTNRYTRGNGSFTKRILFMTLGWNRIDRIDSWLWSAAKFKITTFDVSKVGDEQVDPKLITCIDAEVHVGGICEVGDEQCNETHWLRN